MAHHSFSQDSLDVAISDYLAGRLSDAENKRLETMIAENPEVRLRIDALREQEEALQALGADILDEPLPGHLLAALGLDDEPGSHGNEGRR